MYHSNTGHATKSSIGSVYGWPYHPQLRQAALEDIKSEVLILANSKQTRQRQRTGRHTHARAGPGPGNPERALKLADRRRHLQQLISYKICGPDRSHTTSTQTTGRRHPHTHMRSESMDKNAHTRNSQRSDSVWGNLLSSLKFGLGRQPLIITLHNTHTHTHTRTPTSAQRARTKTRTHATVSVQIVFGVTFCPH